MRQCSPALFLALAAAFGLGGCGGEARQAPAVSPVDDVRSPTLAIVEAHVLHDPALEDGTVLVRDGLVTASSTPPRTRSTSGPAVAAAGAIVKHAITPGALKPPTSFSVASFSR